MSDLESLCRELEHYVTAPWAAREILLHEVVTPLVVDAGCGSGVLSEAAKRYAREVVSIDIHDWGYPDTQVRDWLGDWSDPSFEGATCVMNPPFTKAEAFVEAAKRRGFAKIICFQRLAWYEGNNRSAFWDKNPPSRGWICGSRATCWRFDLPMNERGKRYSPDTGRELAGASTAHAFFVWERGQTMGPLFGRIYNRKEAA